MIPVWSVQRSREFDRYAISQCAIPGALLMENAGRGAAEVLLEVFPRAANVVVLSGPGNNGGDGFVVARRLETLGKNVSVVMLTDPERLQADAAIQYRAWLGVGGRVTVLSEPLTELDPSLEPCDLIVDALFGTGLGRALGGAFAECIARINQRPIPKVALDVPSGLCADSGQALGACVDAQLTVTFGAYKRGLFSTVGRAHRGQLALVDIGLGTQGFRQGADAWLLEDRDLGAWLSPRPVTAHKGTAGHVQVVAGSPGKTGAAWLTAYAALRAGAGRCTIVSDGVTAAQLDAKVVEAMTCGLDPAGLLQQLATASSVVVGPGLGFSRLARAFVDTVLFEWQGPRVVDADALTHFAGRADALKRASGASILTPHPLELARLLGVDIAAVEANRFEAAQRAAEETRAVVVLKGPHTLIAAPGQELRINDTASRALATAGAGDVLAGLMGALLVSLPPFDAACAAVMLHGRAGQAWASAQGTRDRGLLAHEIADQLPGIIGQVLAQSSQAHAPGGREPLFAAGSARTLGFDLGVRLGLGE